MKNPVTYASGSFMPIMVDVCKKPEREQAVYLVQKREDLAYCEFVEYTRVIQRRHCQHGHSELLPQHASRSAGQATQEPGHGPSPGAATSQVTVADVAQQGEQEEEGGALVGPAHDAGHRLRVDGVRGKEQAGQQAPQAAPEEQASQRGKQARHGPVQGHVDKVITPGLQPTHKVVEAEGEGAEGAVGLVAATVRE